MTLLVAVETFWCLSRMGCSEVCGPIYLHLSGVKGGVGCSLGCSWASSGYGLRVWGELGSAVPNGLGHHTLDKGLG